MDEDFTQSNNQLDIFTFANHLAWRVGGPITIEDPSWSIIAYSTLHHRIDHARRHTILRHEVPPEFKQLVSSHRVAERFIEGESFVEILPDPDLDFHRRLAVPVRIHGVVVGSIWVADPHGTLSDDAVEVLLEAAQQATNFFRLQSDHRRRESDIFLSMMLTGDNDSDFLSQYFGLTNLSQCCVLRVEHDAEPETRQKILHLASIGCRQSDFNYLPLQQGTVSYLIVFEEATDSPLFEKINKLAYSLKSVSEDIRVSIGGLAHHVRDIHRSRNQADLVTRYLRSSTASRVARFEDVQNGIALMEMADLFTSQSLSFPPLLAPLAKLASVDHDEALRTLELFFLVHGNATEAARLIQVHPNTYRYRLNRVMDLLGLDLDDPETRLLVSIQLLIRKYQIISD